MVIAEKIVDSENVRVCVCLCACVCVRVFLCVFFVCVSACLCVCLCIHACVALLPPPYTTLMLLLGSRGSSRALVPWTVLSRLGVVTVLPAIRCTW